MCTAAQTNLPASYEPTEFQRLISTGNNGTIAKAMTTFFQTGLPAAKYDAILPLANEVKKKENETMFIFWFRGKNPQIEGDYWVEVTVNQISQIITQVCINGYLK